MVIDSIQTSRAVFQQDSDVEVEQETHKRTRQRQIDIGKARPEYKRYLQRVPKNQRGPNDAHTPDPKARMSKRHFDRTVGEWRRALHEYDAQARKLNDNNVQAAGIAAAAVKLSLVETIIPETSKAVLTKQLMQPMMQKPAAPLKWADQVLSEDDMDDIDFEKLQCAGTPPGSPPPMSPAGTPPGSPPESDCEDESPVVHVRTPSPSPDKYCHRDLQQAFSPQRPAAGKGRLSTLEIKVLERRQDLYQASSGSGQSTPSRISTSMSEQSSQISSKDNMSSFFAAEESSDESVWGPCNYSGKLSPSMRPPADAGLTKEQEKHLTQWMQQAARELEQREDVQEQRLQDGLLAVKRLEKSVKKKLAFAKNSLEQRLVTAHMNQENADMVKDALCELRSLEERTVKAVSTANTRASKSAAQRRSAQVEDLRAALHARSGLEAKSKPQTLDTADVCSNASGSSNSGSQLQAMMLEEMRAAMAELQRSVDSQREVMKAQSAELVSLRKQLQEQPKQPAKPWGGRGRSPMTRACRA